jgi:hypothetical protein
MANPQPTDHHLKIAHSIGEAIMMRDFSKRQRKVLDLILRLSWGCGKKEACVPRLKDFEIVGVGITHVKSELEWLVASHVIKITGTQYSFNKDYDQWKVSLVMPYSPKRMKELIHINLIGYQNGNNVTETVTNQVTETVTKKLPKQELKSYQKGNLLETTPDSAKDSIKQLLNSNIYNPIVPLIKNETWNAFIEMRKKMKAPPTEKAISLLINQLAKLKESGDDPNLVLEQSIMNNWRGVFPLKGGTGLGKGVYHGTNPAYKTQPPGTSEKPKYIDGDAPVVENGE